MKIKWLVGSLIVVGVFLQAETTCNNTCPEGYQPHDADLYRRDVPVFSFHGSFLYWRVQEGALDYALKMQHTAPAIDNYAEGKFHKATFNGEPGFRIAASYFRAPHYWELWGQYTRLTARGKNSVGTPTQSGKFLTGTWPQIIDAPLSEAESKIHLNYNVADLVADRYFNPNPHLRVRFIGGGTAAWINQNWIIRYKNATDQISRIQNKWKFLGGGFRIGTMVDWFWEKDIYLTGTATVGTLLGSYHNKVKQTASTIDLPVRNANFSDIRPAFHVQGSFGPSWQKNFCNARLEIYAGYEINTWFNLQEVYRSTSNSADLAKETWLNTGLIALQGLTTRVTLDF